MAEKRYDISIFAYDVTDTELAQVRNVILRQLPVTTDVTIQVEERTQQDADDSSC